MKISISKYLICKLTGYFYIRIYYNNNAIVCEKKDEFLKLSEKVSNLHLITLNIDVFQEYTKYINSIREKEKTGGDLDGIDIFYNTPASPINPRKKQSATGIGEFDHYMITPGGNLNVLDSINSKNKMWNNENPTSLNYLLSKGCNKHNINI